MKPLEINQRVLTWLYACSMIELAGKWRQFAKIVFTLSIIITHLQSVIACTVFIYKNVLNNLEETLFSLFHTIGALSTLYQAIATVLLKHKLQAIFNGLTKIYNDSKREFKFNQVQLNLIQFTFNSLTMDYVSFCINFHLKIRRSRGIVPSFGPNQ